MLRYELTVNGLRVQTNLHYTREYVNRRSRRNQNSNQRKFAHYYADSWRRFIAHFPKESEEPVEVKLSFDWWHLDEDSITAR